VPAASASWIGQRAYAGVLAVPSALCAASGRAGEIHIAWPTVDAPIVGQSRAKDGCTARDTFAPSP